MSKKKRSASRRKQHQGAAAVKPTVVKVNAVKRSSAHQWWVDHKRIVKPALIAAGVAAVIIITVVGFIGIIW